jgi:hypothetical protein
MRGWNSNMANQLEIYKTVMQHLTGKPVKEAWLLSI